MHGSVLGFLAYGALQRREVEGKRVLEVGSLDVNGSVRHLVNSRAPAEYVGVDLVDGPGVDEVVDCESLCEHYGADAFDVVLCLETMEHVDDWRRCLDQLAAVLRPGGVLVITTRSVGFRYHHPPDRWRYTQGAFAQILEHLHLNPVVLMDDPEFPGVFVKATKPLDWQNPHADLWNVTGVTSVVEPLKLLGLPVQPDGTGYYRYWQPWTQLARASGHDVLVPPVGKHQIVPDEDEVALFDVVSRQRPGGHVGLREWRRWKEVTRLVYETDDDILHPDTSLPHYLDEEVNRTIRECVQLSDLVTCSTEPIAESIRELNSNVRVIPNFIHEDLLEVESPKRDRFTLTWAGGFTHLQDVVLLQAPLTKLLRGRRDVDLHFIGMDYSSLFETPTRFTPWVPNQWDYYRTIDGDVGLIPLVDTAFNRGRTYVKALEFAALGIPVVASDVRPYREFVQHGVTGFLASTPEQWMDAVYTLARDQDLRDELGANARELARRHTIQQNWHLWSEALESAVGEGRTT